MSLNLYRLPGVVNDVNQVSQKLSHKVSHKLLMGLFKPSGLRLSDSTDQHRKPTFLAFLLAVLMVAGCFSSTVWAQVETVRLTVDRADVGLDGRIRAGGWNAMRIQVENLAAEPREVICRWVHEDADGDTVFSERRVTLTPGRVSDVWLYAALPSRLAQADSGWDVRVLDAASVDADEPVQLATIRAFARDVINPKLNRIGVFSVSQLGLGLYADGAASQESLEIISGMEIDRLPDRWYGLSDMAMMVWTKEGGDPSQVSSEIQRSIRDWVRRGGHLVITLPVVGIEQWTQSGLADLLPVTREQMNFRDQIDLRILGRPETSEPYNLGGYTFDLEAARAAGRHVDVLMYDVSEAELKIENFKRRAQATESGEVLPDEVTAADMGQPLIVSRRYGFGAVTLIGVDLSDTRLLVANLPNAKNPNRGPFTIWQDILGWQGQIFSSQQYQQLRNQNEISERRNWTPKQLAAFVESRSAMSSQATVPVLLAVVVFGLYWLIAGLGSHFYLAKKNLVQHSWVAFVVCILVFAWVTWGGAWVMQPTTKQLQHFTILDIDGTMGARRETVRAKSWLSVFTPNFGAVDVRIAPEEPSAPNTMSNIGFFTSGTAAGFLDSQTYQVESAFPNHRQYPGRATTKQFAIEYYGEPAQTNDTDNEAWGMPNGEMRVVNGQPFGELTHNLPGALMNPEVIYCPGNGEKPVYWRMDVPSGRWQPQAMVQFAGLPGTRRPLVMDPPFDTRSQTYFESDTRFTREGILGDYVKQSLSGPMFGPAQVVSADAAVIRREMMLATFYSLLPPPDFRNTSFTSGGSYLSREAIRRLDWSPLTKTRRLIIIGHLSDSPLPLPLTVDEQSPGTSGMTVVRWTIDL